MPITNPNEALAYHKIWLAIVAINQVIPGRVPAQPLRKTGAATFNLPVAVVETAVDAAIAAFSKVIYQTVGNSPPPAPASQRQRPKPRPANAAVPDGPSADAQGDILTELEVIKRLRGLD